MYRRRSFHPRPRRRFHRRPAVRNPTRVGAGQWQWGNFFTSSFVQGPGAAFDSTNVLVEIVSLEPNHFQDISTPAGGALAVTQQSMVKSIDVGGIVFDMGMHNLSTEIVGEGLGDTRYFTMQGIILDKKNPSTGIPNSANANYAVATFPSVVVDASLPRPSFNEEIRDYPSRILYKSVDYHNPGLQVNTSPDDELLASRTRQEVLNPQRHRSLRIKRRLTDDWGLYGLFSVWNTNAPIGGNNWLFWMHASVYYRIRY